jgi:membrane associated rhomboid family serine protease
MGIYDREYYRREGPSFLDTFSTGRVCRWLIGINVAALIVQMLTLQREAVAPGLSIAVGPGWFTKFFWLDADAVLHGQVWRLVTYAFLHSTESVWHIVFNMLLLWFFGRDVEDLYGPREFLAFYLTSVVVGGLVMVLSWWATQAQLLALGSGRYAVGASAAVTAVLVLIALHEPGRIIRLFFVLPVPIWLIVVFQLATDLFGFLGGDPSSQIGFGAHLGGAAFAFLYYKRAWRLLSLWPDFRAWQRQRSRPKLRLYREEAVEPSAVPVPSAASAEIDEQLEAKLDAVLEKVARLGQASLTEQERQILFRASEVYKKRRT